MPSIAYAPSTCAAGYTLAKKGVKIWNSVQSELRHAKRADKQCKQLLGKLMTAATAAAQQQQLQAQ